ncbi:Uncharacterized protein TCM_035251 [Theobroma cacao]|uniref:Uncharacterized protein n=1 Tax=Theobroma cacao TaxID=3641 RepID=A0A061FHT0_THECC|nr:Uncharacterized protein TCM_035251 [Theobroma cacao]
MGVKVHSNDSIEVLREPKVEVNSAGQGMKLKMMAEPRFKQKNGSVFPTKRKLVKKMMLEYLVKSLSSPFLSFGSSQSRNTKMSDS